MPCKDPQQAFEALTEPADLTPVKENWLILYKDKPIQLKCNGKFRWNRRHQALTALTHAWYLAMKRDHPGLDHPTRCQWLEDFKKWRETNILFECQEAFEKSHATPATIEPAPLDEEDLKALAEIDADEA